MKLKPFCSMRPGIYILIIIALLIFSGAFLLFVLPGLVSDIAYVTFDEPIIGSGVWEDGNYLGNANDGVYRTSGGKHTYAFSFEGIEYSRVEVDVEKKIFFSLFSHSPVSIAPERSYSDEFKDAVSSSFVRDVSKYSAVLEHDDSFNFPPVFSTFAENVVECGISDVREVWLLGAAHVTGRELYEDYMKGREILEENNISFSSPALARLEKFMPGIVGDETISIARDGEDAAVYPLRSDSSFVYYSEGTVDMGRSIIVNAVEAKDAPV
ncbi:MAG: hypothetical protein ACI4S4_07075, partial [Candidatus Ornithospirochaeta sp.]